MLFWFVIAYWLIVQGSYQWEMAMFYRFLTRMLTLLATMIFFLVWWFAARHFRWKEKFAMFGLLIGGIVVAGLLGDKTTGIPTMMLLGLPVIYIVLNDGALGMVKHGQRLAGAEPIGFELPQVDFAAMAAAMGIPGQVIRSSAELDAVDFDALLARPGPTLLDVRIDGEQVPPMNLRMRTLGTAR